MPYFLFNVLTFLFSGILMFRMDWRLALVALFMLPPLCWVSYLLLPRYWHAHGRRSRTVRSLYSLLNDNPDRRPGGPGLRPGGKREPAVPQGQ